MDIEHFNPHDHNAMTAYIVSCARTLMEDGEVTVRTTQGYRTFASTIYWDNREMVYRYHGDISKGKKCESMHHYVCTDVMTLHLRNMVGVVLCDNGPHSACPLLVPISEINNMDCVL